MISVIFDLKLIDNKNKNKLNHNDKLHICLRTHSKIKEGHELVVLRSTNVCLNVLHASFVETFSVVLHYVKLL